MDTTNYGKVAADWLEATRKVQDVEKDMDRCKQALNTATNRLQSLYGTLSNSVSVEEPRRLICVDNSIVEVVFGSASGTRTTVTKLQVDVYTTPKVHGVAVQER